MLKTINIFELLNIADTNEIIQLQLDDIRTVVDVIGIPNKKGNELLIISSTDDSQISKMIRYDYTSKNAIDTVLIPLPINFEQANMLDSNIMTVYNKQYFTINVGEYFSKKLDCFIANRTLQIINNNIQFKSIINRNYDSLEWDFGDGEKSFENNPRHTYTKIGYYTVKLLVYRNNRIDSVVSNNYIQVYDYPNLEFDYLINNTTKPYSLKLMNKSTMDSNLWKPENHIFGTKEFDIKGDTADITLLYSGIYQLGISYVDRFGNQMEFNKTLEIYLPKYDFIESEKYYYNSILSMNSCLSNNRLIIYGSDKYLYNMKFNFNCQREDYIINHNLEYEKARIYPIGNNYFLNYCIHWGGAASFITDSNFNYIKDIRLCDGFNVHRTNKDSTCVMFVDSGVLCSYVFDMK